MLQHVFFRISSFSLDCARPFQHICNECKRKCYRFEMHFLKSRNCCAKLNRLHLSIFFHFYSSYFSRWKRIEAWKFAFLRISLRNNDLDVTLPIEKDHLAVTYPDVQWQRNDILAKGQNGPSIFTTRVFCSHSLEMPWTLTCSTLTSDTCKFALKCLCIWLENITENIFINLHNRWKNRAKEHTKYLADSKKVIPFHFLRSFARFFFFSAIISR